MRCTDAAAGVTVEVFVEEDEVIGLSAKAMGLAREGAVTLGILEEDCGKARA